MRNIEYTDEQKIQIANDILRGVRTGDDKAILANLESIGYRPPQPDPEQVSEEERRAYEQHLYAQEQARLRQREGADYNNNPGIYTDLKKQMAEMKKMKEELIKERASIRQNVQSVETAVLADKFHSRVKGEVDSLIEKFPALKNMEKGRLIETVKNAKHDYYKENEKSIETEEVLKELHNEMAEFVNAHITEDDKKLKIIEDLEGDEKEEVEVKDEKGNVIGTLTEEGVLKSLSSKDTGGDGTAAKGKEDERKIFEHSKKEVKKDDGTIVIDDDIDTEKIVQAASDARESSSAYAVEGAKKVDKILDEAMSRGGDDESGTADAEADAGAAES